ncbi:MAG: caspase domain-containing protein [Spirosomataceae bacterium]
MRKIAILLFLSLVVQSGFAQIYDCQEPMSKLSGVSGFNNIGIVYREYLQSKIGLFETDTLNNAIKEHLDIVGRCFLEKVENEEGFAEYEIGEEYLTNFPGLIFMLLVSPSIDKPVDKQGWFSILPLMNDDQIEKLSAILYKENKKLGEIAKKYKTKSEPKSLEMTPTELGKYFLAIYKTAEGTPVCGVGFLDLDNKFYLLSDKSKTTTYTLITKIHLGNYDDVIGQFPTIKDNIKARFDEFRPDYEQFLLSLKPEQANRIKIKNYDYVAEFGKTLINEWIKTNNHFTEVEKLLNLNFNTVKANEKQEHYYTLYSAWEGREADAMSARKKYILRERENYSHVSLMFDAFYIANYEREPTCVDSLPAYSRVVLNLYEQAKDDLIETSKSFTGLQADYMVWDYVKHYNKNQDFKTMATTFLSIYDGLLKNKENFRVSDGLQSWYYGLTDYYRSGKFQKINTLEELSQAFEQLYVSSIANDDQKVDAKGEFYVYYCLWQSIYNPNYSTKTISSVLKSTTPIYQNPNLKSYRYIEKDIAKVLEKNELDKSIQSIKTQEDKEPPIIVMKDNEDGKEQYANGAIFDILHFTVTDRSKVTISVSLNGSEHTNWNKEEVSSIRTRLSIHYITLKVGKNELIIKATDEHGNEKKQIFSIIRADKPIKNAKFYALIIGIDKYNTRTWTNLSTCVSDCRALAQILSDNYQFTKIDTLYNEQATRANILKKLNSLKTMAELDSNSNVLVYYSGHGTETDNTGYWVPFDIDDDNTNYFQVSEVKAKLKTVVDQNKARHCFVMVDACYSGSLFNNKQETEVVKIEHEEKANTIYTNGISLQGLTSGGLKPVPSQSDICGSSSSTFGCALLMTLRDKKDKYLSVSNLSFLVKQKMDKDKGAKDQTPVFGALDSSMASGSEFLFIRK